MIAQCRIHRETQPASLHDLLRRQLAEVPAAMHCVGPAGRRSPSTRRMPRFSASRSRPSAELRAVHVDDADVEAQCVRDRQRSHRFRRKRHTARARDPLGERRMEVLVIRVDLGRRARGMLGHRHERFAHRLRQRTQNLGDRLDCANPESAWRNPLARQSRAAAAAASR